MTRSSAFENLIGGLWSDSLTGDNQSNALAGGLGNDTLNGGAGADRMDGGDGNDVYYYDNAATRSLKRSTVELTKYAPPAPWCWQPTWKTSPSWPPAIQTRMAIPWTT